MEDYIGGLAEMKASRLFTIATAAGVSPVWLQTGATDQASLGVLTNEFIVIALLSDPSGIDRELNTSHPTAPPAIALHRDLVPQSMVNLAHNLRALRMPDDSMSDTIFASDVMLINTAERAVQSEGIYALRLDGQVLVKRLQRRPGAVLHAQSDNRRYEPFELPRGGSVELIGRVVWSGGAL